MIESPTWKLLAANPALIAIVPKLRIFKAHAGDSPATPYIVIEEISGAPENYTSDRPGIDNFRATVKVVTLDAVQSRQIATLVRDTLETEATCHFMEGPLYENETKLMLHLSDWSYWSLR